jgi:hypothetical protein
MSNLYFTDSCNGIGCNIENSHAEPYITASFDLKTLKIKYIIDLRDKFTSGLEDRLEGTGLATWKTPTQPETADATLL